MENVSCPISVNARCHPHQYALLSPNHNWTYQALDSVICSLCKFLKKTGIKENHRVAFIAQSTPSTIFLFFALLRLKAIACPLSFRIPEEQLFKHFVSLKPSHILEPAKLPVTSTTDRPTTHSIHLDQLATFLLTSGSSEAPKIVCHSYGNHYYNAMGVITPLQLDISSRWLLSLPLFHVSGIGILFRCFLSGSTLVLANPIDLRTVLDLKISHLSLVPTQLYRLLNQSSEFLKKNKHSLKCILLGGAPIPPALLDAACKLALPIFTTYGMTEMSSIVTLSHPNVKEGSGKIALYRNLKIDKDQEIWVSGKTLFKGYWNSSYNTVIKVDPMGWFPTKDLGQWINDDQLQLIGRKDRQFISGGENIQPEIIERALCNIPGIQQASVLPVQDVEFGERPIAFIDDALNNYSLEKICEKLQDCLPRYMHPIHIFSYPPDIGIKPNLSSLKQYLAQTQKLSVKNQE